MQSFRQTEPRIAHQLALVERLKYRTRQTLPPFRFQPSTVPLVSPDLDDEDWSLITEGSVWGEPGLSFTLRSTFLVPREPNAPLAIVVDLGFAGEFVHPEALAYVDGEAYQGISAKHQEILLRPAWCDGQQHGLALWGWLGNSKQPVIMGRSRLAEIHQPTRRLAATARVALGVLQELDDHDPVRVRLLNALDDAFRHLDLREPLGEHFYAGVEKALATLQQGIAQAGPALDVDIVAVGHAHIDVAWLWSIAQTRRKVARTFSSVLRLMEQFPEFCFLQSQPQLYQYLAEDHPQIFQQVRARVAEGRWEPTGGMWIEADCNLSGAEALVRQLMLGRSFFREAFGEAETPILWLPDTFGFPWTLPQLIQQAGLKYFMTTKISWNQTNRLPYDSFWWKGLDGTQVLTHCITTPNVGLGPFNTYNGDLAPRRVIGTWRNCQLKETHSELLTAFGWGDGGGGPTREMLENSRCLADHPGAPRVRQASASEFFANLERGAGDRLPIWDGELYLEFHRGTYTSQARTKRHNRKAEFSLHDAEFLAAWAALETDFSYPRDQLTAAWRLLCLNQFHDILPGSSIGPVYQDSARDFQRIFAIAEQVREAALASLASQLPQMTAFLAVNPTSFGGQKIGLLPEHLPEDLVLVDLVSNTTLATQPVEEGLLVELPDLGPYGLVALGTGSGSPMASVGSLTARLLDNSAVLENDLLRIELDLSGEITSLWDKSVGREVLPPGQRANIYQAFEDRPLDGDAWNIGPYYEDKGWPVETSQPLSLVETGPLRASFQVRRRVHQSEIVQRISLVRGSARLDFETWVEWRERHVLLKVAFPVAVLCPQATYDIQWGNIQRPTHRNTSWDWARYETCGHKWVDLSEADYGVSLLNDCKYGHDVRGNVLRLTLLRGPTYPDPNADLGQHHFTYSLLPHQGDWRQTTAAAAYALNDPPILRRSKGGGANSVPGRSLVDVKPEHVIIETVKQAEDGRGLIVRLYESQRRRGEAVLHTDFPLAAVQHCNLLEEDQDSLAPEHKAVRFPIKPYEIVTLRLTPRPA
jgi:alpha-mannosidase